MLPPTEADRIVRADAQTGIVRCPRCKQSPLGAGFWRFVPEGPGEWEHSCADQPRPAEVDALPGQPKLVRGVRDSTGAIGCPGCGAQPRHFEPPLQARPSVGWCRHCRCWVEVPPEDDPHPASVADVEALTRRIGETHARQAAQLREIRGEPAQPEAAFCAWAGDGVFDPGEEISGRGPIRRAVAFALRQAQAPLAADPEQELGSLLGVLRHALAEGMRVAGESAPAGPQAAEAAAARYDRLRELIRCVRCERASVRTLCESCAEHRRARARGRT